MTQQDATQRIDAGWWGALTLFLSLCVLVALRAWAVDNEVGTYIACPGCFHRDVLLADLVLFSTLASLLLMASFARRKSLARIPHFAWGLIVLIYGADLVVFSLFNSRLLMADAALFAGEGAAVWDQFSSGMGGTLQALLVLLLFGGMFVFLWWLPSVPTRAFRILMSGVLVTGLAASVYFQGSQYVNDWAVENVFVANMSTPARNHYASETQQQVLSTDVPAVPWRAEASTGQGRNVIMVIVESWSAWHSELFGGFENWTPRLDAAAQQGLRFDNFHSIGFSTDKGLVGILGGQPLWAPFLHWFQTPPFHSMWGLEGTLPQALNGAGYHTAFLTSGPISLYRKGEWMVDIGFAEVEGNEHPFYQGRKRFAFGAASDRALYQRAVDWMNAAQAPWFLALETVSTHQPYRDPDTDERSLERVMKYADREFGTFLEQLESNGFFDNGVLLVVSDHRSMTPMSRLELDTWGTTAHSRIPAFVIGEGFEPGSVSGSVFSQSDLAPTFSWWAAGEVTLEPFEAVMFDPDMHSKKCALHERSDRRGLVEVICDDGHGQVMLDGDQTRFTGATDLEPERQQEVLQYIARQRIEAWRRHLDTEY